MYRRPMSPYNSRVQTYLQALERDETINSLRRQYAHHRSVEAQYDDLKYEISKAERENKKIEEKNLEIQEEYMEKIKANKALIGEIGTHIQDIQGKIKSLEVTDKQKQLQNQQIISTIKQTKTKITANQQQNKNLQTYIQSQDTTIQTLNETLQELMGKKKQAQVANKKQSEIIDGEFDEYKELQERTKAEEAINLELREELAVLRGKKSKLETKVGLVQEKMREFKRKLEQAEFQSQKLGKRCHEAEKQSSKVYAQALTLKQNIQQSLTKNKDHTSKLKSLQVVLKQNINGLHSKHSTKQKLAAELADLTKDIEKAEAVITTLDQETQEQETANKGLIQNLKKSIQSDEEAVKALTRKAAILNLISQS